LEIERKAAARAEVDIAVDVFREKSLEEEIKSLLADIEEAKKKIADARAEQALRALRMAALEAKRRAAMEGEAAMDAEEAAAVQKDMLEMYEAAAPRRREAEPQEPQQFVLPGHMVVLVCMSCADVTHEADTMAGLVDAKQAVVCSSGHMLCAECFERHVISKEPDVTEHHIRQFGCTLSCSDSRRACPLTSGFVTISEASAAPAARQPPGSASRRWLPRW